MSIDEQGGGRKGTFGGWGLPGGLLAWVAGRTNASAPTQALLLHQDVGAAVGEGDKQVHQYEHEVVVPAGAFFAPKTGVPGGDFFPDGAEHDQDQPEGGKLCEDAKGDAKPSGEFADAEEDCEALRHPDAFRASFWIFEVAVAARHEDEADHQAQKKQAEIGEACQGKHEVVIMKKAMSTER